MSGPLVRVAVERLGDGLVLLQVADRWHLVLTAADAEHVGVMLAGAASPDPSGRWQRWTHAAEDQYCAECGHVHTGPELGGICIGCPCERTA